MSILNEIEVFDMDIDDETDPKMLIYADYLDALVRIADRLPQEVATILEEKVYMPLEAEDEDVNGNISNKQLIYVIYKLEQKCSGIEEAFINSLEQKDGDMNFLCKMVVNDESDDEEGVYDDDDEGEEDEYN